MIHETPEHGLHLPTLTIAGFRGIRELSIGRLGRVTLLTGNNGVGKTTVLEAVRVFAARGHQAVLSSLLRQRDEYAAEADDDDDKIRALDFAALFFGRSPSQKRISIGPGAIAHQLTIEEVALTEEQLSLVEGLIPELPSDGTVRSLLSRFEGAKQILPFFLMDAGSNADGRYTKAEPHAARVLGRAMGAEKSLPGIRCRSLGPGVLANNEIAHLWKPIALTDDEDAAVEALRMVVGDGVHRAAVVAEHPRYRHRTQPIVRFKGDPAPVPLKSLGDGAVRLFGVALALANSRHGFLVIDEAENGIHHSIQKRFWRMVLETADANNVQVLATTHSRDCVEGFARAAAERQDIEGTLVRINRRNGEMWAVEYPEKDMLIAAEQGIEVR
ncbi:AAA family ATPase [Candidatus Palauibacter sp.]|uniref:AAA family ATPase n=1 Tax=Candidatus Palauibacter sp. TaxID=3101350 RepID=UPI003B517450